MHSRIFFTEIYFDCIKTKNLLFIPTENNYIYTENTEKC